MERRRQQRQNVAFPMEIFQIGEEAMLRSEVTTNISSGGGICFHSGRSVATGSVVQYRVTLSGGSLPVAISCVGRVVRCRPTESQVFEIAMTMERYRFMPVSQPARVSADAPPVRAAGYSA